MVQSYNYIFLTPGKNGSVLYELLWENLQDLLQVKNKNGMKDSVCHMLPFTQEGDDMHSDLLV